MSLAVAAVQTLSQGTKLVAKTANVIPSAIMYAIGSASLIYSVAKYAELRHKPIDREREALERAVESDERDAALEALKPFKSDAEIEALGKDGTKLKTEMERLIKERKKITNRYQYEHLKIVAARKALNKAPLSVEATRQAIEAAQEHINEIASNEHADPSKRVENKAVQKVAAKLGHRLTKLNEANVDYNKVHKAAKRVLTYGLSVHRGVGRPTGALLVGALFVAFGLLNHFGLLKLPVKK